MKKEYKKSIFKVFSSFISGLFAAGAVGVIIGFLTDKTLYALIAGLAVLFLSVYFIVSNLGQCVTVSDGKFTIRLGKKQKEYDIHECGFSSRIKNRDDFRLTVTLKGGSESYDLSFLSYNDYMKLLEDLHVVGEKQDVIRLTTIPKK